MPATSSTSSSSSFAVIDSTLRFTVIGPSDAKWRESVAGNNQDYYYYCDNTRMRSVNNRPEYNGNDNIKYSNNNKEYFLLRNTRSLSARDRLLGLINIEINFPLPSPLP